MIDSDKLMGRMQKNGTVLSETSISNLGIVRKRLVDIDGMLKYKLVLSKVREKIKRQEDEKLKRIQREDNIEDDDRDYDLDEKQRKGKKPKPDDGSDSVLTTIGGLLTGGLLAFVRKNFGALRIAGGILKSIGSVASFIFSKLATAINLGYSAVTAINSKTLELFGAKGLQTLKQFQTIFTKFVNVAVISSTVLGTSKLLKGSKVMPLARTPLEIFGFKKGRKMINVTPKQLELNFKNLKSISASKSEVAAGIKKKLSKEVVPRSKIKISKKIKKLESSKELVKSGVSKKTAKTAVQIAESLGLPPSLLKNTATARQLGLPIAGEVRPGEVLAAQQLLKTKSVTDKKLGKFVSDVAFGDDVSRIMDAVNESELKEMGFDPNEIKSNLGSKASRQAAEEALLDEINKGRGIKSKKVKVKPDTFLSGGKKGLSKLLSDLGGSAFIKPIRQFINNTVGRIPFFGDLIGLLLDIFLFKEPVGRAAFMAIGGILGGALGALIGSLLPGPGTFVGGLLGGIGGDIIGGITYDLIFGKKPTISRAKYIGKKTVKESVKNVRKFAQFSGGGLVGNEISNIASSAYYDNPSIGSVQFIPIPIPSSSSNTSQGSFIASSVVSKTRNSQSSLYAGGLA